MCGIYFSLSRTGHENPSQDIAEELRHRGPDYSGTISTHVDFSRHLSAEESEDRADDGGPDAARTVYIDATASVLSLRGGEVIQQPIPGQADAEGRPSSLLCWNGEAWSTSGKSVTGNDSIAVFNMLQRAVIDAGPSVEGRSNKPGSFSDDPSTRVITAIRSIAGPYAFIFYDGVGGRIYYGRDCLGRRSLLQSMTPNGSLAISSIADTSSLIPWVEVDADVVNVIDLEVFAAYQCASGSHGDVRHGGECGQQLPYILKDARRDPMLSLPGLSRELPSSIVPSLSSRSEAVTQLEQELLSSLTSRILRIPHVPCLDGKTIPRGKIAILFSGGLDCTVLARLAHIVLPLDEPIHLLNVAFENPRVIAARNSSKDKGVHSDIENESHYEACPDRVTGRRSFSELRHVCPGRDWIFAAVRLSPCMSDVRALFTDSLQHSRSTSHT
jgi:asparagine synthetase B (glutamine-hydrolysing)